MYTFHSETEQLSRYFTQVSRSIRSLINFLSIANQDSITTSDVKIKLLQQWTINVKQLHYSTCFVK